MSFQFIDESKIDGNARKLIRSHVMKGKNAGQTGPRPPRKGKQSLAYKEKRGERREIPILCKKTAESYGQTAVSVSANVGNAFSLFQFPCEMQPYMRELIVQCKQRAVFGLGY
jgi:hypothetical protein